jgi:inosose dehydratase
MVTRREVLRSLTGATLKAALLCPVLRSAFAKGMPQRTGIQFGAQTNAWPIDPKNFDSFLAVLKQIRQTGYTGFETGFANVAGQLTNPQEATRRIATTGLTFFAVHIFLPADRYDPSTHIAPASLYQEVATGGAALGAHYMVLSGAPVRSDEELKGKIAGLNAAGEYGKRAGVMVAYHNHAPEFDSKTGEIDALYARTDPELVSFLFDAGHAYQAGADVPAFLRTHQARIVGIHLRDYRNGQQVPLGQGTFPLAQSSATLKQLDWRGWLLNEEEREDGTKAGLKFIEPAFKAMQAAFSG